MPLEVATEPPFGHMTRQVNKLMDQMQKGFFTFAPSETWTPNVNLYENDQSYLVCVDLSGVVKEEIDLQVHEQTLTLRGRREVPMQARHADDAAAAAPTKGAPGQPAQRLRVHLMEIDHGHFSREVDLPDNVESHQISATYRNGLLWIEVPKKK
jgi:HSP20 family protein